MDRATNGLRSEAPTNLPTGFDPTDQSPLDRATAIAALTQADDLLEQREPDQALLLYSRATASSERDVAAAGYYGLGNVLYRLDRDTETRVACREGRAYKDLS